MLNRLVLLIIPIPISSSDASACDSLEAAEAGVCLMQFMSKQGERIIGHADPYEGLATLGHCPECPGGPFVGESDPGKCSHGGADVVVDFDDENIEEFFGDNVLMKEWKYFLEECEGDCEIISPNVNQKKYQVGKTVIRVEGYDISGNMRACHRTVYILDKEAPRFTENPAENRDETLELHFPASSCDVPGDYAFHEYKERAGFNALAEDNCKSPVDVVHMIYDEHGHCVFNGTKDHVYPNLTGPSLFSGTWDLCFEAIDDYTEKLDTEFAFGSHAPSGAKDTKTTTFCVTLTLTDITPPEDFVNCPEDIFVEIEANETQTAVYWSLPTITFDNCEDHGVIPPAKEQSIPPKEPGQIFEVGSHVVSYALEDSSGNVLKDKECTFTVEVKQKAHPVVLTCPANVTFETLPRANFAIVKWQKPVATQGGKTLPDSLISYPQGVRWGLPFPFGTTPIKVRADGEQTGDRTEEHLRYDECTFFITVTDPHKPEVDGRLYRCKDDLHANTMLTDHRHNMSQAKPYRICGGTDVYWRPHDSYVATHGYAVLGTTEKDLPCCTDQHDVEHHCVKVKTNVDVEPEASYCVPVDNSSADEHEI
jgi:hypothetical protein